MPAVVEMDTGSARNAVFHVCRFCLRMGMDVMAADVQQLYSRALNQLPTLRRALEIDHEIFEQFPEMKLDYQDSLTALQGTGG